MEFAMKIFVTTNILLFYMMERMSSNQMSS